MALRHFLAALAFVGCAAHAGDVRVAVAANFTAPMQKIAAAFEQATGHRAVLAFGSTGRFYAQVKNGAPFDVLVAADDETPARLEQEALAVPGSRFTYALGRLVLWSVVPGLTDPRAELLRSDVGAARLAIADPRLASYGAAALQVLEKLGVSDRWRPRLVQGESIAQAFQFVATGNATFGFVALAQVRAGGQQVTGATWIVPASLHAPIRQDAVLLARGQGNPAATALLHYLRGNAAGAVIRAYGYEL